MGQRNWSKVVAETREKINSPTPVTKILSTIKINHPKFKRLVKDGVLVFVDKIDSYKAPPRKRYKVSSISQQIRTKKEGNI